MQSLSKVQKTGWKNLIFHVYFPDFKYQQNFWAALTTV